MPRSEDKDSAAAEVAMAADNSGMILDQGTNKDVEKSTETLDLNISTASTMNATSMPTNISGMENLSCIVNKVYERSPAEASDKRSNMNDGTCEERSCYDASNVARSVNVGYDPKVMTSAAENTTVRVLAKDRTISIEEVSLCDYVDNIVTADDTTVDVVAVSDATVEVNNGDVTMVDNIAESVIAQYLREFADAGFNAVVTLNNIASKYWSRKKLLLDFTTPLGKVGLRNSCCPLLMIGNLMIGNLNLMILVLSTKGKLKPDKIDEGQVYLRGFEFSIAIEIELLDESHECFCTKRKVAMVPATHLYQRLVPCN